MKRIGLLLILMALCVPSIQARFLGVKKSSETVAFFLRPPLDSLYGIQRKPDSVHIFTYLDNASAAAFQTRSTTYPFSDISIDTLKHFTDTMYVFADAIADIDGAGCNCVLTINVQMYYDKTPTHTFAEVQIINDSLTAALDDATLALAEVVNIDAWNPITDNDSLIIDQSSLEDMTVATVTQVTNDVGVAAVDRGRIGDSAAQRVWNHLDSAWAANTMGSIVADSTPVDLNAIRDSLQYLVSVTDVNVASVDAGAIESGDIAAGGIGATEIATDAIGAAEIASNAIGNAELATNAISAATIAVGAIDADAIASNAIGAAEIAAGAITISEMPALAYNDTVIYDGALGRGIWIDINAANTSTAIGTDGTEKNPVSTLAAARTLADALGVQRYYFTGQSSFTGANDLTVTHEDWEFIGIGTGNAIELDIAGIDVDGSFFFHITLSGVQGGTGDVTVAYCIMGDYSGADGFIHNSGLSDTIRIASTDDLYLDQCFSMVAGNGTPGIGFGAGNSNLNMRHYAGGIEIHDMDGNDKATVDGVGQVILNDDCTNPSLTIRGDMSITYNTNTVANVTVDAAWNRTEYPLWAHSNLDTINIDTSKYGTWLSTGISASLSDANMGAIADSVWKKDTTGLLDAGKYGLEATTGGAASISNAAMGAIADSVWDKAKGDMVAVSEGAGDFLRDTLVVIIDSTQANWLRPTVAGRVLSVDANNLAQTDVLRISQDPGAADSLEALLDGGYATMFVSQLRVIAQGADQTAVVVTGKGTGHGMQITGGDSLVASGLSINPGDSGAAVHFRGANDTALATFQIDGADFHAVGIYSTAGGSGIDIEGTPGIFTRGYEFLGGAGMQIAGDPEGRVGTGARGLIIQGFGSGAGLYITNDDTTGESGNIATGAAMRLAGLAAGKGFHITTLTGALHNLHDVDTTDAFSVAAGFGKFVKDSTQGAAGSLDSTAVYGAVEQLLADSLGVIGDTIDVILTAAHSAGAWTTGGSGSGANTVVVWTVDSTTNDTLSGVFVAVYNTSNSLVGTARSGATGAAGFSLDNGTYYFIGTALGYTFPPDTTTISGNPDTTAIEGDQYEATAASGDSVCTVTVNVVSSRGTALSGVWITANLSKSFVVRWDGTVVYNREQRVRSNSSGQVTFYCLYSTAMDPNTDWTFATEGPGRLKRTVTIPSSATTTIDFGY